MVTPSHHILFLWSFEICLLTQLLYRQSIDSSYIKHLILREECQVDIRIIDTILLDLMWQLILKNAIQKRSENSANQYQSDAYKTCSK